MPERVWRKGIPLTLLVGTEIVTLLKVELPYDPSIPLLGIYPDITKI